MRRTLAAPRAWFIGASLLAVLLVYGGGEAGVISGGRAPIADVAFSALFAIALAPVARGTLEAARRATREAGLERATQLLRHPRNRGKTESLLTGGRAARGEFLVLLDADLQYAPDDIPRFLEALEAGHDVVTGRKVGRRYSKRWVSSVYNWLARRIFGVPVHDLNSMKAFRREVLENVRLRHDWHRFFVVLAHARGYRVTEVDVLVLP